MNFLQMHVLMGRISLQSIVNAKLSPEKNTAARWGFSRQNAPQPLWEFQISFP